MALTITYIGRETSVSGSSSSFSTLGFDTSSYDYVVVAVIHRGAPTTITVTDSIGSGTYTGLTKADNADGDNSAQLHWKALGTPGAGTTWTITYGAARTDSRVYMFGIATDTSLELDVEASGSGNGTDADAGTLTTTAPTVSVMAAGHDAVALFTPSTGWTEHYDGESSTACSRSDASGTLNPSTVMGGGSKDWVCVAASFREPSAGGTAVLNVTVTPLRW